MTKGQIKEIYYSCGHDAVWKYNRKLGTWFMLKFPFPERLQDEIKGFNQLDLHNQKLELPIPHPDGDYINCSCHPSCNMLVEDIERDELWSSDVEDAKSILREFRIENHYRYLKCQCGNEKLELIRISRGFISHLYTLSCSRCDAIFNKEVLYSDMEKIDDLENIELILDDMNKEEFMKLLQVNKYRKLEAYL